MTTMIFDLPKDLIEEILCKIPLTSMRKVRLTCKKWNTLSKNRSFSKLHLSNEEAASKGESQRVVIMGNNLYLMRIFVDIDPSTNPKFKLSRLNEQVKISEVFHCDGLLLCILRDDNTKFVVWNPYLGQTRWIKTIYSYLRKNRLYMDRYTYALGYVNKKIKSCRSYKILRFFDNEIHSLGKSFLWYEIYDFDSDLWTTFEVPTNWELSLYQRGVSLNGNIYLCATRTDSEDEVNDHLICFDFTRERFGQLLHFPFIAEVDGYVTLSCVREEKLAALFKNQHDLEIWITTKIETENVSWSKFLRFSKYLIVPRGFFIDEENKVAMGFDKRSGIDRINGFDRYKLSIAGEDGYIRRLDLGETSNKNDYWRPNLCSYVPSLVQIKQLERGCKRKKTEQSSRTKTFLNDQDD